MRYCQNDGRSLHRQSCRSHNRFHTGCELPKPFWPRREHLPVSCAHAQNRGMEDREIEIDLSQFTEGSIVNVAEGLQSHEPAATRASNGAAEGDDVDEAALEALMWQAQAFAPLSGALGVGMAGEEDSKHDSLGLTTLEDTAASSEPPPRGHLAVIDRLYKWERRRSAKLDKARREEQQRLSKEEHIECTFSPQIARPVSAHRRNLVLATYHTARLC